MNKNMLYCALAAVGGALVGAVIGSHFTYRKVTEVCREQYEDELNILKHDYAKRLHTLNAELKREKTVNEYVDKDNEDIQLKATVSKIVDEYFSKDEEPTQEPEKVEEKEDEIEEDLEDFDEDFDDDEEEWGTKAPRQEETEVQLHTLSMSSTTNAPYVLPSASEFGELEGYSLSSLTYYPINDVLADENNEALEYPAFVVGAEAMETLKTTNLLAIYVRNDVDRVDYEIMIDPDTDYYEM